jgi:hypothetical protein
MKYTNSSFINSSIDKYGAASPLFLGQAHVIFAANKIDCNTEHNNAICMHDRNENKL